MAVLSDSKNSWNFWSKK